MVPGAMILVFWMLSFKPTSFTFIKRLFSSSLSAIRVVLSVYLRLLIFLPAILIPACASYSPVFLMMYSEEEASITQWLLTSCYEVPFVIGHGLVLVCGLGVLDPRPRLSSYPFPIWFWPWLFSPSFYSLPPFLSLVTLGFDILPSGSSSHPNILWFSHDVLALVSSLNHSVFVTL